MMTLEVSQNEEARLDALRHYGILDTPHETSFDEIVLLAAQIGQAPVALLSFLDEERQWIKAAYGFSDGFIPRRQSFCAQAILQDTPLIVSDTRADEYFRRTPLAASLRDIRFYAGAPLIAPDGFVIGTLSIMDRFPRSLAPRVRQALVMLARQAMRQLELRRQLREATEGNPVWAQTVVIPPPEMPSEPAQLTEETEFYRALFQQYAGFVCVHDLEGRILAANPAGAGALGYLPEELAGRCMDELLAPEVRGQVGNFLAQVKEKGAAQGLMRVADRHGEERIWRYNNKLYESPAHGPVVVGCAYDVTEQRMREAELELQRAQAQAQARGKADYLAKMSHEIRTPINGIVSMAHLLARTGLDAEQRSYLDLMRDSADWLVTLINDLLDYSKLEAGRMVLEQVDFDLLGLVETAVTMFAEAAQRKGLELAVLVASDVPLYLQGDPGRLRQVLNNLISNAIKFTEHGEVVVQVEKLDADARLARLRFSVRDTGIGIAEEFLPNLYQAYAQAPTGTVKHTVGTGLGLAISRQLVEMMGGKIEVESKRGQGTTFRVTVEFSRQPEIGLKVVSPQDLKGLRVLIVDDNAASGKILHRQTTAWGMLPSNVSAAARTIDALRRAAKKGKPFDVAIIDWAMPGLDGIELARRIHSHKEFATLPTILLTAFGWRGQGQAARNAGLSAYLTKPVRQAQLFECLVTVLGLRAEETAAKPLLTRHNLRNYTPLTSQPGRVLLVEDNEVNQQVALHQLYKLGYTADVAGNGREALAALAEQEYDIILLDCQMPEMDGYQTAAAIRRQNLAKQPLIVALTGYFGDEERQKCLAAGMHEFLSKPVKLDELGRVLENWREPRAAVAIQPAAVEPPPETEAAITETPEEVMETKTALAEDSPDVQQTEAVEEVTVAAEVAPEPEIAAVTAPVVDLAVLARLISRNGKLKPALAIELIDIFLQDAEAHRQDLQTAWPERDAQRLHRAAHTLKSSSASMGAQRLVDVCAAFTKLVAGAQFDEAEPLLGQMETELQQVCAALQEERGKLR
jgi:PAS domain S-box-containing protein